MTNRATYPDYSCDEYFSRWRAGFFEQEGQHWLVLPSEDMYEVAEREFLAIGTSGCSGIDFGYRRNLAGIWAYYPIEGTFKPMAPTIEELVAGWCSNRLTV